MDKTGVEALIGLIIFGTITLVVGFGPLWGTGFLALISLVIVVVKWLEGP